MCTNLVTFSLKDFVKGNYVKKVLTVMVNKTNNHLSTQLIEHKKKTTTYGVVNPGLSLGQAQKYSCVLQHSNEFQNLKDLQLHMQSVPITTDVVSSTLISSVILLYLSLAYCKQLINFTFKVYDLFFIFCHLLTQKQLQSYIITSDTTPHFTTCDGSNQT